MTLQSQINDTKRLGRDSFIYVSAATTVEPWQQTIHITGSATFTITMPSVKEASGKWYALRADADFAGTATVAAPDAEGWSNLTANAANDSALLYSDGKFWHKAASVGSM
jgi:predicted PhzF superfamily epimerase YddE/YHI9